MKRAAPEYAQVHYDRTLCFVRRMEEFRLWSCSCCRIRRVANIIYQERRANVRSFRAHKRTKRYEEEMARARAEYAARQGGAHEAHHA